jgi:DNA recombination protein RmuC
VLAAALAADPELYEHAQRSRVVLSSPATLLAVLRAVAFTWQQDALASNARELLTLGADLYERLGTLAGHADAMGRALTRSVEAYNGLVGSLETRVLTTARRMHDLGVSSDPLPTVPALSLGARVLTAPELVGAVSHRHAPPGSSPGG